LKTGSSPALSPYSSFVILLRVLREPRSDDVVLFRGVVKCRLVFSEGELVWK
jgi:hypothetical protein